MSEIVSFSVTENTPNLCFLVSLSDGSTIVEDERPGEKRPWQRVCEYVKSKGLHITELRVHDRKKNITKTTPPNQSGYFYSGKCMAVFPPGISLDFVGLGYLESGKVHIVWRQKDDLNKTRKQAKLPGPCIAGETLIVND